MGAVKMNPKIKSKDGAGGKYTWGTPGCEGEKDPAISKGDPNFEEGAAVAAISQGEGQQKGKDSSSVESDLPISRSLRRHH